MELHTFPLDGFHVHEAYFWKASKILWCIFVNEHNWKKREREYGSRDLHLAAKVPVAGCFQYTSSFWLMAFHKTYLSHFFYRTICCKYLWMLRTAEACFQCYLYNWGVWMLVEKCIFCLHFNYLDVPGKRFPASKANAGVHRRNAEALLITSPHCSSGNHQGGI